MADGYISQITLPNNTTYNLRDDNAVQKTGDTMTGGLEIKGHIAGNSGSTGHGLYSGGGYHNAYNNIILHGDASTGTSGIAFISDKGETSINQPSDRAFIQWHAHGVTTYSTEGNNPTLATSGESNILMIGVGNDATDQIRLQTPGRTGLLHQVGNTGYVIPDTNNTTGSVGGTTTPVYVDGGIIKAATSLEESAYHADSYFVKAVTSTDNAIVRFDGTSGQVQDSKVTIDDNGNMTVSGTALKVTATSGQKYILIGNQDSGGTNKPAIIQAANGSLSFGTGTDWSSNTGGTLTTTLFMNSSNNVGIGTTSPSHKLEVNGTVHINDTTTINNVLTLYREGTTSNNYPARITFSVKDTTLNTTTTAAYIAYYHDHTTTYNGNLVINSNGGTFIGAGESASTLYTALGSTSSTENLYLTADNVLYAYAYADTAANRIGFAINTSGHIVPQKAEGKNNNAQNLGASDNKWANIYVTTVTSFAASLTSATSSTANTIANATLTLGNNANVNSTTAHSEGQIILYSAATAAHTIKGASTTTAYTHTLPNNTGLLVSLSGGTAKGSSTKPIYIPATGIVTECSTYAGGTKVTLNNSDKGASSAAFYAPTSGGTVGQPLIGAGTTTEPAWYGGLTLSGSAAATWVASFAGTTASDSTTSGAVKIAGGLGVVGQVTAARLAANGSNTNYKLYVNGASYLKGNTVLGGDLSFDHTGASTNGYITWSSGSWYQRIMITDDSTANTAVFTFQQSSNSGSTYTNLFTILDNKSVATDRYNYTVSDVIKAYTQYNATDDSIDFIFA